MPQSPVGNEPALHLLSMPAGARAEYVRDFIQRSDDFRSQVREEWADAFLRYANHVEPRADWKSNLRFALEYAQVETAKSSIFKALTDSGTPVRFKPLHAQQAESASLVTAVVHHLLWVQGRLSTHLEDWLQSMCNYGPGVFKIGWGSREVVVPVMGDLVMGDEEPVRAVVDEKRVVVEGPSVMVVDPWDYFPDPEGDDEEAQELIGHRVWLTRRQIERRVKAGLWNKKAAQQLLDRRESAGGETTGDTRDRSAQVQGRGARMGGSWQNETTARFPAMEVWSDRDVVTTAEIGMGNFVELRGERNRAPHQTKPFVVEHHVRVQGDPLGYSMTRFVGPISDAISAFHNQANDTRRLAIDGRPIVRDGIILRNEDLVGGPGDPIRVPNPATDIKPYEVGGRIELAGQEESVLLQWADRVGAQSDPGRGMPTPGGTGTATEVNAVTAAQATRALLVVARAARGMERLYHKALTLCQQNMRADVAVQMMGRRGLEWRTASPQDLAGVFLPVARCAFLDQDRVSLPNRWLTLGRDFRDDPYLDPIEFRKRLLTALGEEETEGLLVNPFEEAEIPQEQENMLLLQGYDMPVKPNDDHASHLMAIQSLMSVAVLPDGRPNTALQDHAVKTAMMRHAQAHMQALAAQQQIQMGRGTSGGAPNAAAGGSRGRPGGGGGGALYDGANSKGRALAARTPGGGQGAPPGPQPAERGGGVA